MFDAFSHSERRKKKFVLAEANREQVIDAQ